jgi:membrane protein required for colicin V production
LAVMILAGIAGRIARWIMKEVGLSFFDRILGGLLGLLRGCLVVAVVLVSMAAFTPTSRALAGSSLAPYFLVVGRAAIWVAPAELRGRFYQGLDLLHHEQQEPAPGAAKPEPGSSM